jgi:hypothetical protein
MVFPDNGYISFVIDVKRPVNLTFPNKKPKKIWLDAGSTSAFRLKINDDDNGILIHMNSVNQKSFEFPSTINSISITTSSESEFFSFYID